MCSPGRWSCIPAPSLVLSLIEARQVIEPAAARFAALRARPADIAPLEDAFARMGKSRQARISRPSIRPISTFTPPCCAPAQYRLPAIVQTIGAALAYSFRLTISRAREPGASLPNHGEVIERIRLRDSEGAYASMARLLNIAIVDLGIAQSISRIAAARWRIRGLPQRVPEIVEACVDGGWCVEPVRHSCLGCRVAARIGSIIMVCGVAVAVLVEQGLLDIVPIPAVW